MKRLVLLAVLVAAVGCGGDPKPPPTEQPQAPNPAAPTKGKQVAMPE